MLQKLNERIQGLIAWVVIILIAITFTLFGVDYYIQSRRLNDVEVKVNGEAITKQFFEINYRRTRQQRDPASLTAQNEKLLREELLRNLMINLITVQGAKENGFTVNPSQANAAIVQIPQFQEDGHFSSQRYMQALNGAMFTPESFQKEVQQGMLLNQQRFAFIGTAFVLPTELKRFVKLYMQTRDYDFLLIPARLFNKQITISDSDIQTFYKQHLNQFLAPEAVSVRFIRLSLPQLKRGITIDEKELEAYYQENQNNFLNPAQWKVAHILFAFPAKADEADKEEVKQRALDAYQALQNNPAQFSEWAKTLSSDKLAASQKGELPWITAGQTEFDSSLLSLTKPDSISPPFLTSHGYEIFKLIAYKPAQQKTLNDVKTQIKEQLLNDKAQIQYTEAVEKMGELGFQTPDNLSGVADALNLPIEESEAFTREGGNTELTKNKRVIQAAFSHEVKDLGNNSEPLQLDNDTVVILRLKQHIPASQRSLAQVKSEIARMLSQQQAQVAAQQWGLDLLKRTPQETTSLLNSYKLTWQNVIAANRETDKVDPLINDLAFSLSLEHPRSGSQLLNGDFVLVTVKAIHDGNINKLDKEQQASISQQIETNYGLMDYDLYLKGLEQSARFECFGSDSKSRPCNMVKKSQS